MMQKAQMLRHLMTFHRLSKSARQTVFQELLKKQFKGLNGNQGIL